MPFLNQRKGKHGHRNDFMINLNESYVAGLWLELVTPGSAVGRTALCSLASAWHNKLSFSPSNFQLMHVYISKLTLTHISQASCYWDIGKQCRPRSGTGECGLWSVSSLFAYRNFYKKGGEWPWICSRMHCQLPYAAWHLLDTTNCLFLPATFNSCMFVSQTTYPY